MPIRTEHIRQMVATCEHIARTTADPAKREQFLLLALDYEKRARLRETVLTKVREASETIGTDLI